MRFVALKSESQLDVQTLHRVRDQLVGERTALTNQIRSVLLERGHVVAQGRAKLTACLAALLDTDAGASLTPRMRTLMAEVRERWQDLDRRIAALDAEFAEQTRINEDARRLTTIPGIGALNATALLARSHVNTAVVALAAKMARIVWALLRYGRVYEPAAVTA